MPLKLVSSFTSLISSEITERKKSFALNCPQRISLSPPQKKIFTIAFSITDNYP